jgi:AraC-like DNA-binding protein
MTYFEFKPPKNLQHYVRLFWMYEGDENIPANKKAFRIIADGCPGLIFQYTGNGTEYYNQNGDPVPDSFLYGHSTKAINNYSTSNIRLFGVYLQPYSIPMIFGFGAEEITDTPVDFSHINSLLRDQIIEAGSFRQRIDIIAEFIRKKITHRFQNNTIQQVVNLIEKTGGTQPLDKIYSDLHSSERHFVRLFKRQVGITPKHFSRITRFQSTMNALCEKADSNYAKMAFDYGYSDQSHFVRDFKAFSGFTPSQFHFQCREVKVIQNYPQLDNA